VDLQTAFVQLQKVLSASVTEMGHSEADIFVCDADLDETGCFLPGSGWETALERLRQAVGRRQNPPAIIVMGSQTAQEALQAGSIRASTAQKIGIWEGLAYLQYGFTRQHFVDTAQRAIARRGSPLPALDPNSDELRKRAFALRHWLQNKRKNIDAAAADFVAAADGSLLLSAAHLADTKASTPLHDRMLEAFIGALSAGTLDAEAKASIAKFASMIEQFKENWEAVECLRRQVRQEIGEGQSSRMQTTARRIAECLRLASTTIVLAIKHVDTVLERPNESSGMGSESPLGNADARLS